MLIHHNLSFNRKIYCDESFFRVTFHYKIEAFGGIDGKRMKTIKNPQIFGSSLVFRYYFFYYLRNLECFFLIQPGVSDANDGFFYTEQKSWHNQ